MTDFCTEMKPWQLHFPCKHEGGSTEVHPLTKRDIELLLRKAQQTSNPRLRNSIQIRLEQAIPSRRCPLPISGDYARREQIVAVLYLSHKYRKPTRTLVNKIFNAIYA